MNPFDATDTRGHCFQLAQDLRDLEDAAHATPVDRLQPLRVQYRRTLDLLRELQATLAPCATCGSPAGTCYTLCPDSPAYYSPEAERADSLASDAMSHDAWHAAAAAQYQQAHGTPWCS